MIVVHTSTLMSRCQKSRMIWSSCFSPILPWAVPTLASGTSSWILAAMREMSATRLCT